MAEPDAPEMKCTKQKRCQGVLLGILAGDKNGGPSRMAIRLAESLHENDCYNVSDVALRYLNWHCGPPYDPESSFDTGPVFGMVMAEVVKKCPREEGKEDGDYPEKVAKCMREHAELADKALKGFTAGVNVSHRSAVIAMLHSVTVPKIPEICNLEGPLTHWSPKSTDVAIVTVRLCRLLIEGHDLISAIKIAGAPKGLHSSHEIKTILTNNDISENQLKKGGFAPNVLQAALFFLLTTQTFDKAMSASIKFAGSANYCPVLVGSIGGALYGVDNISDNNFDHIKKPELLQRAKDIAVKLSQGWGDE